MNGTGIAWGLGLASIFWFAVYLLFGWVGVIVAGIFSAVLVLLALAYFWLIGVPEDHDDRH